MLGLPGPWAADACEAADSFTSKIGGLPDWPAGWEGPPNHLLRCSSCGQPLGLIAQVYAPLYLSGRPVEDRCLYVFGCAEPSCKAPPPSRWRVFRVQREPAPPRVGSADAGDADVAAHASVGLSPGAEGQVPPGAARWLAGDHQQPSASTAGSRQVSQTNGSATYSLGLHLEPPRQPENCHVSSSGGGTTASGWASEAAPTEPGNSSEGQADRWRAAEAGTGTGPSSAADGWAAPPKDWAATAWTEAAPDGEWRGAGGIASAAWGEEGCAADLPSLEELSASLASAGLAAANGSVPAGSSVAAATPPGQRVAGRERVFPCFYLYAEEEPPGGRPAGPGPRGAPDDVAACEPATSAAAKGSHAGESWEGEGYEYDQTVHADRAFLRFRKRLERSPEQCLRYSFRGPPLLAAAWSGGGVPACQLCGAARAFELQLMPPLLSFLHEAAERRPGRRHLDCLHWDWLTLLVFTCGAACLGPMEGTRCGGASGVLSWAEEVAICQFDA